MGAAQAAGPRIPWSLLVIAGGGLAGLTVGLAIAATRDKADAWRAALVLGILFLLAATFLVGVWSSIQPFALRRSVPIAADDIYDHAAHWFGRAPWTLSRSGPNELVYRRKTESSVGLFVVLLLLGIVPAILYFLWARGTQTIAIGFSAIPGGTDLEIVVHPQLGDGRKRAVRFFNSLHDLVSSPPLQG